MRKPMNPNLIYFFQSFSISECWSPLMSIFLNLIINLEPQLRWEKQFFAMFCKPFWLPRLLYAVSLKIFWQISLSWKDFLLFQVSVLKLLTSEWFNWITEYQTNWITLSTLTNFSLSLFSLSIIQWLLHFQASNLTLMI